jgi:hypothetical protein
MDNVVLNFGKLGGAVGKGEATATHHQMRDGLAEKHFRPIEIEARKIKEQQKSNLSTVRYH